MNSASKLFKLVSSNFYSAFLGVFFEFCVAVRFLLTFGGLRPVAILNHKP